MVGRSTKAALYHCRLAINLPCNPLRPLFRMSKCFSSTPSHSALKPVPTLIIPPTADTQLETLLNSIRNYIFLPAYLQRFQRGLVYREKYWPKIRKETINAEIAGETFRLTPIDRKKDVPRHWPSLVDAINRLAPGPEVRATEESFKQMREVYEINFIALLRGFREAGLKLDAERIRKLARNVGLHGQIHALIKAARIAEETGLYLRDLHSVRNALWGCREGWVRGVSAGQSLRYAEQIAIICEGKEHLGGGKLIGQEDPRSQVDCIGILLELACLQAYAFPGQADRLDKVKTYSERMLGNMDSEGSYLGEERREPVLITRPSANFGTTLALLREANDIQRWLPAQRGLDMAMKLLGEAMPRASLAKKQEEILRMRISDAQSILNKPGDNQKFSHPVRKWLDTPSI